MSDERSPGVPSGRRAPQRTGDGRPGPRDGAARAVTSGEPVGTDGEPVGLRARLRRADRRDLVGGGLAIAAISLAVASVNAMTTLSDAPDLDPWEPWVWEGSSVLMVFALIWLPWLTAAAAPPADAWEGGWPRRFRFAATHLLGALAYSAVHVAGFVVLRQAVYGLLGAPPYDFGDAAGRFLYEFRKDLLSYAALVAVYWLARRLRRSATGPLRPVSFDIRDGGRIIRAPLDQIVAVSSAGNYVEFWLGDGRRPLMRATLAAIEVELEGFGFVRAHRSWLVNARRVTGLRPDGSGDWTVELGAVEAPLSRRYPQALERLKAPD